MANVAHASLTGSNLHEPKGVENASAGMVYVADGAGSGEWTLASSLLSIAAWSTGDVKSTFKSTADDGWVLMNDDTIGDASSGATNRANADCEDLFTLLWNNVSDSFAPVSGGRGASAANDWAAHKTITLPRALGRALASAGNGSGLSARNMGQWTGVETHTLTSSEIPTHSHSVSVSGNTGNQSATHTHSISITTSGQSQTHVHTYDQSADENQLVAAGAGITVNKGVTTGVSTGNANQDHTHSVSGNTAAEGTAHVHSFSFSGNTGNTGSGSAHTNVQPTLFVRFMVKL